MKPLSRTMKDCLHWLLERDADELWVQVDVGGYYTHNTLNALEKRGLIEIRYRANALNPNGYPRLDVQQAIYNSRTCAFNDPWVKLINNDA